MRGGVLGVAGGAGEVQSCVTASDMRVVVD